MDKKKLGELFGVVVHSPVTRSEVRSLVKAKQDFVNKKATDEDLTYHQALLDAGDIVESFINSLSEDDGKAFVNYYSDEVVAIGDSTQSIDEAANKSEAEGYHLQAQFIFNELSANLKVYGSNSALTGANPADVNLAIEYIDRSLEIEPNNPTFLNLKGLLIWNGLGDKARAKPLIERAAELAPRDITIQHNLKSLQDPNGCFIATAAFGTPVAYEVNELRLFRDKWLVYNRVGRLFIKTYYKVSPRIANFIQDKPFFKKVIRAGLKPLIQWVEKFNKTKNY